MSDPTKTIRLKSRIRPSLDTVTTINEDGSKVFLHPADVHGWFTRWRRHTGLLLIAIYLLLPWIQVGGHPAVFLDVAESRFHCFGFTLAAQDVWLLFFGITGVGFALFFLTALFGRLWCGWACPQTVFLEHIYRRIERMIEGDAPSRRQLDAAPMGAGKFARRTLKHGLYIVVSLVITHLFLAYYVSVPELWHMMSEAPGEHWGAFLFVFVSAGILYFNFAWFREQLCIVICPYGRLQSALTDDHSLVIGYDAQRGEPRGKIHRPSDVASLKSVAALEGEARQHGASAAGESTLSLHSGTATGKLGQPSVALAKEGACIDCQRCVQVCPTGIDIRHGLQLECIGCAACIDACDEIMTKVDRPKGLIRYDSHVGLHGQKTRWLRPRTLVYGLLLVVGVVVASFAFSTVKPAGFMITRMTGAAYYVTADEVRNQFMVRLVNKRSEPATFTIALSGLPAEAGRNGLERPVIVAPLAEQVSPLVLHVNRKHYRGAFPFTVSVQDHTQSYTLQRTSEFLGPDARLLKEDDHEKGIQR